MGGNLSKLKVRMVTRQSWKVLGRFVIYQKKKKKGVKNKSVNLEWVASKFGTAIF